MVTLAQTVVVSSNVQKSSSPSLTIVRGNRKRSNPNPADVVRRRAESSGSLYATRLRIGAHTG
jgi:hypothetical protein